MGIERYTRLLAEEGVSLLSLGLIERGLPRQSALIAVDLLRDAKAAVLGGDVYVQTGDMITPAYANWYCDRREGENYEAYLRRGWEGSETHIRGYPQPHEGRPIFVLVTNRDELKQS